VLRSGVPHFFFPFFFWALWAPYYRSVARTHGTDYYVASDSWAALHQSTHHLDALRLLSATVHRQGVARWYLQCSSLIVEMRPDAVVEKPDVEMFATHDVAIVREGFHAYSRCDGSSRIQLLEGG